MADQKPTSNFYKNLGGVNQKASLYEMSTAQFLDLRNMDFDVPNALQKRPGQTFALGTTLGTSGPINSLYEFIKLSGASFLVAGSNTAMFYVANGGLTTLSTGWNNAQRTDMLTFADKLWMANGQNWQRWDGSTVLPVGLLCAPAPNAASTQTAGASWMSVAGLTHIFLSGSTYQSVGIYLAMSYVRNDGYVGPVSFFGGAGSSQLSVRQLVSSSRPIQSGGEFFGGSMFAAAGGLPISGFTGAPGLSAFALFLAMDMQANNNDIGSTPGVGPSVYGIAGKKTTGTPGQGFNLRVDTLAGDVTSFWDTFIDPGLDTTQFYLYTLIPATTATFVINNLNWSSFVSSGPSTFSAMVGNFFSTYTPKYIEVSNNSMFAAGFSNSPSTVIFSEIGEPESFAPTSQIETRTNDGDIITGLAQYNDQFIVTKEKSFFKIIGDDPDNYQLVQVSDQYGCLNQNTIVKYDQKIVWLDRSGILEYNGANHQIISTPVEGIFRRLGIRSAKVNATAVHYPDRKQIWFGIPIDEATTFPGNLTPTSNNITVVYDYFVGAWTFFDGYTPAVYALAKQQLVKPSVWRGDYSGMIHYFGSSFYSDSGTGITCSAFTRFDFAKENETWIWRRFFLDTGLVQGIGGLTGAITGKVYSNYQLTIVQATFTMYQVDFQTRAEMGVVGKAAACEFSHFSASLPFLINGYSWAKRGLRNV